jgi:hypothetical protein
MKTVAIRFSTTAHFDVLVDLHERSIEKLRDALEHEFVGGESWQRLLIGYAGNGSFDCVFKDEDIEIHSADILEGYPFVKERVDIEKTRKTRR